MVRNIQRTASKSLRLSGSHALKRPGNSFFQHEQKSSGQFYMLLMWCQQSAVDRATRLCNLGGELQGSRLARRMLSGRFHCFVQVEIKQMAFCKLECGVHRA